ncbi:MAG: DUF6197 family protein [Egibacteraceae bacterium]
MTQLERDATAIVRLLLTSYVPRCPAVYESEHCAVTAIVTVCGFDRRRDRMRAAVRRAAGLPRGSHLVTWSDQSGKRAVLQAFNRVARGEVR